MSMSTNANEKLIVTHVKQGFQTFESGFHWHFPLFLIAGISPDLCLHKPWLTESSGVDQSIINPWESAFIYYLSSYYLALTLGNIQMSTDSILIG